MKHCIDIYSGWIVAFVDGQWRKVHIEPGWVTFAFWHEPNQHLGICKAEDISLEGAHRVTELATSPHALVGGPVLDKDQLDRIGCVRVGRIKTLKPEPYYTVAGLGPEICADLDDKSPNWEKYRVALPSSPRRWTRTARSLVIS